MWQFFSPIFAEKVGYFWPLELHQMAALSTFLLATLQTNFPTKSPSSRKKQGGEKRERKEKRRKCLPYLAVGLLARPFLLLFILLAEADSSPVEGGNRPPVSWGLPGFLVGTGILTNFRITPWHTKRRTRLPAAGSGNSATKRKAHARARGALSVCPCLCVCVRACRGRAPVVACMCAREKIYIARELARRGLLLAGGHWREAAGRGERGRATRNTGRRVQFQRVAAVIGTRVSRHLAPLSLSLSLGGYSEQQTRGAYRGERRSTRPGRVSRRSRK